MQRQQISGLRATTSGCVLALGVASLAITIPVLLLGSPAQASACPNAQLRAENPNDRALPDCRAYEQVSPVDKEGQDVEALAPTFNKENGSDQPFESSPDGNAVVYVGNASPEGNGHINRNVYVASRGPQGWLRPTDLSPVGEPAYLAFSPDLSTGILSYKSDPLQSGPPLGTEAPVGYEDIFLRESDGRFRPLNLQAPPDRPAFHLQALFAGASSDLSHVVFEANDALTKATPAAPAPTDPGEANFDIYDWSNGQLSLVNVLPGNVASASEAIVGAGDHRKSALTRYEPETIPGEKRHELSHAVSDNGSRIFWTDLATGKLYLREDSERTVELDRARGAGQSGGGDFQTASADGSRAFFTDANLLTADARAGSGVNLYMYEAEGDKLTDLTPEAHAEVRGVVGASEDGSYVYFVALGNLAGGATTGADNLYVWHEGTTTFIATLASRDEAISVFPIYGLSVDEAYRFPDLGVWTPSLYERTAEASPNGRYFAFTSKSRLTAYENVRTNEWLRVQRAQNHEAVPPLESEPVAEVYFYDAAHNRLSCASCIPSGAAAAGESYLPPSLNQDYQPASVSEEGAVVFDSQESLLPQDTNGATDVYEYENGALYLISAGNGPGSSFFDAMSPNGADVFLTTQQQLVAQDTDEAWDIYDARAGGGFPVPLLVSPCGGEETCRGPAGAPPPALSPPASASVVGPGNLTPPTVTSAAMPATPQAKPKSARCRHGFVRKRRKCVKQKARRSSAHSTSGKR